MNRLAALVPVAAFLALLAVFAGYIVFGRNPQVIPRATVGKIAPDDRLPTLEGLPPAPLRAAIQGPTLVNFFASWCAPCADEAPALMALKAEGVRIVGVAWKDDPAKTLDFLVRNGDPYAVRFVDRDGQTAIDFGVTGAPETYLVGADGLILDKKAGALTAADAEAMLARSGR